MASLVPIFRRGPDGRLSMSDTREATAIKKECRQLNHSQSRPVTAVREKAKEAVKKAGGDVNNRIHLLGCMEIQYGCFRYYI